MKTVRAYTIEERLFPHTPEDWSAINGAYGRASKLSRDDIEAVGKALEKAGMALQVERDPMPDWKKVPISIDPSKTYKTRDGRRVVNVRIVETNGYGECVTYPVKGSILQKPPKHPIYTVWTADGHHILGKDSPFDLVEATE
jgi:hypothetical protein